MSKLPDQVVKLSDTLTLCEFRQGGSKGFWLYDETRGMNLAMGSSTEREALVEALEYYQERLTIIERCYKSLKDRVDFYVTEFTDSEENY